MPCEIHRSHHAWSKTVSLQSYLGRHDMHKTTKITVLLGVTGLAAEHAQLTRIGCKAFIGSVGDEGVTLAVGSLAAFQNFSSVTSTSCKQLNRPTPMLPSRYP